MFGLKKAVGTPREILCADVEIGVSWFMGFVGMGIREIIEGLACNSRAFDQF